MTSLLVTIRSGLSRHNRFSLSIRHASRSAPILLPKFRRATPAPGPEFAEDTEAMEDITNPRSENWRPNLPPTPDQWKQHRDKITKSFPGGWNPPRKLSRDAMDSVRDLHAADPSVFTTTVLADRFMISPEAVRRILKGKWQPSDERRAKLLDREAKHRAEAIGRQRNQEKAHLEEIEREMAAVAAKTGEPVRQEFSLRHRERSRNTDDQLSLV